MTFESGDQLAAYRIDSRLGAGAFTTDYLATDASGNLVVAKVLGLAHTRDHEVAGRFVKNAEAFRSIRSSHLAAIVDTGRIETGQPFLVRKATDRGTLSERVRLGRPGCDDDIRRVTEAVSAGLSDLHAAGVCHGALRASSVLLSAGPAMSDVAFGLLWEDDQLTIDEPGLLRASDDGVDGFEADLRAASVVVAEVALGRFMGPDESPHELFTELTTAGHFDLASALAAGPGPRGVDAGTIGEWGARIGAVFAPVAPKRARELTLGQSVRVTVVTAAAAAVSLALGGVVLGMSEASPLRTAEQAIVGSELSRNPIETPTPTPEPIPTVLAFRELPPADHEECLEQNDRDDGVALGDVTHLSVELDVAPADSDRSVTANGEFVGDIVAGEKSLLIDELAPDTLFVLRIDAGGEARGSADGWVVCAQTMFVPQAPRPTFSPADATGSAPGTKVITLGP